MHKLLVSFFTFFSLYAFADWTNLNTGINDDLSGVVFKDNKGLLSGKKGLYYTFDGAVNGAGSWTRFNISSNTSDSIIYNNTSFTHCFSNPVSSGYDVNYYACGEDTINHKAVLFKINSNDLTYTILYYGASNSKLNEINCPANSSYNFAVGDNGLIVVFTPLSSNATIVNLNLTTNLKALSFYQTYFSILSEGVYYRGSSSGDDLTINYTVLASGTIKDIVMPNGSNLYLCGENFYSSNFITVDEYHNFDFGPLNGRSITRYSNNLFIGTDHGIFKSSSSTYYAYALEWQPSSLDHSINEFWFTGNNSTQFFACGDSGILLRTTDAGGASKPYANILFNGGCEIINGSYSVNALQSSSTNCSWYKNNVWIGSGCTTFNHNFGPAGSYELKVILSNGTYSDTAVKTIQIVPYPKVNLPVSLMDSILCKEESVHLIIDSTQLDVYYTMKKFGSSVSFGVSAEGNDSILNFSTLPINANGNFYLVASSTLANCSKNFTDTIKINVEHTKANFHSNKVNSEINEEVSFFEHTFDAQNFKWTFSNQASDSISNLADPVNSFNQLGNIDVKLVCWSDNGCYDSIQSSSTRIYSDGNDMDSCWTNVNYGIDPPWAGNYTPDICQMSPAKNGYLICGYYKDCDFTSRFGDSLSLANTGSYIAKYDLNGTVKWHVKTNKTSSFTNFIDLINSVVEDQEGNIYASGQTTKEFIDNSGDTLKNIGNFLIKLDSLGKVIWYRTSIDLKFSKLYIDNSNNLLVQTVNVYENDVITVTLNGLESDTLYLRSGQENWEINYVLLKLEANGSISWDFEVEIENSGGIRQITFDQENNIYMTGTFEHKIRFFDQSHNPVDSLMGFTAEYGGKMFLLKFDSSAVFQWKVRSYSTDSIPENDSDDTQAFSMATDSLGNSYISGSNNCNNILYDYTQIIENTDGTLKTFKKGAYYVAKFNTDGVCQWIQGASMTNHGNDSKVLKTDHEIAVVGRIRNIGITENYNALFTSSNGMPVLVNFFASDYFVAYYDFDGNLSRVIKNGNNTDFFYQEPFNGFFEDEAGHLYLSQNMNFNMGGSTYYENFGDTLISNQYNEYEGLVTKFKEACGYVFYPLNTAYEELDLCYDTDYEFPDGHMETNITSTFEYFCYLTGSNGLDSLIVYTVTPHYYWDTEEYYLVCTGSDYTFPDGTTVQNITASMNHSSTLTSQFGCDSTVITYLTPRPNYNLTASDSICSGESYTFPDGTIMNNILSNMNHSSSLQTVYGCDSIIQTNIIVKTINATLLVSDNNLTSQQANAAYQWLDCADLFSEIPGANSAVFTPLVSGNYALEISKNACIDTSDCINFNLLNLQDLDFRSITIYPNPTNGAFTIDLDKFESGISLKVFDLPGQELFSSEIQAKQSSFIFDYPNGVYILELNFADKTQIHYSLLKE